MSSKIAQAKDAILNPLMRYVNDKTVTRSFESPEIMVSEIEDASLAGGAAMVFEHFINGDFGEYEKVLPIFESSNSDAFALQGIGGLRSRSDKRL